MSVAFFGLGVNEQAQTRSSGPPPSRDCLADSLRLEILLLFDLLPKRLGGSVVGEVTPALRLQHKDVDHPVALSVDEDCPLGVFAVADFRGRELRVAIQALEPVVVVDVDQTVALGASHQGSAPALCETIQLPHGAVFLVVVLGALANGAPDLLALHYTCH